VLAAAATAYPAVAEAEMLTAPYAKGGITAKHPRHKPTAEPVTLIDSTVESTGSNITGQPESIPAGATVTEKCGTVDHKFKVSSVRETLKTCKPVSKLLLKQKIPSFGPLGDTNHNAWTASWPATRTSTLSERVGKKPINAKLKFLRTGLSTAGVYGSYFLPEGAGQTVNAYGYTVRYILAANSADLSGISADLPLPSPSSNFNMNTNDDSLSAQVALISSDGQLIEEGWGISPRNPDMRPYMWEFAGTVNGGYLGAAKPAVPGQRANFAIKQGTCSNGEPGWVNYLNNQQVDCAPASIFNNFRPSLVDVEVAVSSDSPHSPTIPMISPIPGGCAGSPEIGNIQIEPSTAATPHLVPSSPGAYSGKLTSPNSFEIGGGDPSYNGFCPPVTGAQSPFTRTGGIKPNMQIRKSSGFSSQWKAVGKQAVGVATLR